MLNFNNLNEFGNTNAAKYLLECVSFFSKGKSLGWQCQSMKNCVCVCVGLRAKASHRLGVPCLWCWPGQFIPRCLPRVTSEGSGEPFRQPEGVWPGGHVVFWVRLSSPWLTLLLSDPLVVCLPHLPFFRPSTHYPENYVSKEERKAVLCSVDCKLCVCSCGCLFSSHALCTTMHPLDAAVVKEARNMFCPVSSYHLLYMSGSTSLRLHTQNKLEQKNSGLSSCNNLFFKRERACYNTCT